MRPRCPTSTPSVTWSTTPLAGPRRLRRGDPGRRAHGRASRCGRSTTTASPPAPTATRRWRSVGLTEAQGARARLRREGRQVPLQRASARREILGKTRGLREDRRARRSTTRCSACTSSGPHATDLIAEACVALKLESDRRGAAAHHPRPPDAVRGGDGSGARRPGARDPHVEGERRRPWRRQARSWGPLHAQNAKRRRTTDRLARPSCRASASSSSTAS